MDAAHRRTLWLLVGVNLIAVAGVAQLVSLDEAGPQAAATVRLTVFDPDAVARVDTLVPLEAGHNTALDALLGAASREGFTVGLREYAGLGVMVVEILGVEAAGDCGWIYHVNGESGDRAADAYRLEDDDRVEWRWSC